MRDWVKKLKENSASVFDSKIEEEHKEKLRQKENQIKELKNLIGEQTVMIDWVKKKYREAGFQWENEPHG